MDKNTVGVDDVDGDDVVGENLVISSGFSAAAVWIVSDAADDTYSLSSLSLMDGIDTEESSMRGQ